MGYSRIKNLVKQLNMLYINQDTNKLNKEFEYYLNSKPSLNIISTKNYIIKYFQQNVFYAKEQELFCNENIAYRLIENRIKYLHKSPLDISDLELLDGFKKSGIYYGYSHFNPNLFKWFIKEYNCKKCYDPCGGWGHRLLGALNLDTYIYNDISSKVVSNIKNIINFFDIDSCINIKLYNEDSRIFCPSDEFDSIFTCPPYFNLEHYDCEDFKDLHDYHLLLDNIYQIFQKHNECKVLGLILREDLILHNDYKFKFNVGNKKSEHLMKNKKKKYNEYLYVYLKENKKGTS